SGARARESEGLRTSQSTRTTLAPLCAMSVAIATATVDLPSLGRHEISPRTLDLPDLPFKSNITFTARIASAYGDKGSLKTARNILGMEFMFLDSARRPTELANFDFIPDSVFSAVLDLQSDAILIVPSFVSIGTRPRQLVSRTERTCSRVRNPRSNT